MQEFIKKLAVMIAVATMSISVIAEVSQAEFDALKKKVEQLQRQLRERSHVSRMHSKSNPDSKSTTTQTAPTLNDLADHISFSGLLETELMYGKTKDDNDTFENSDLSLATMEFGIQVRATDWLHGDLLFLWEDGDDAINLDEALIHLGNLDNFPLYLDLGKMYLPFGRFDSGFISDPITLEMAEINEHVARLGFVAGRFDMSISVFNGDVEATGKENHINNFVLAASYADDWEGGSLEFGVAYINSIADADGLEDAVNDSVVGAVQDYVGAYNVWATLTLSDLTLIAEYIATCEDFSVNTLSFDGPGNDWNTQARMKALNLEMVYTFNEKITCAVKFEKSEDTFEWMPEVRYGVAATYQILTNDYCGLTLSVEYLHGKYDDINNTKEDTVTMQLALEF